MSKKISELTAVTDVTPSDLFQVIDVEDPAMASSGTNKKVTAQVLGNFLPVRALGTTTTRTLSERFKDTVNVKDFGAAGDGIQDDGPAIQTAINFKAGSAIYFPKGNYRFTNQILIYRANTSFIADSCGSVTLQCAFDSTSPAILVRSDLAPTFPLISSVNIINITIRKVVTNTVHSIGVEFDRAQGIRFMNSIVSGFATALSIKGGESNYFSNLRLAAFGLSTPIAGAATISISSSSFSGGANGYTQMFDNCLVSSDFMNDYAVTIASGDYCSFANSYFNASRVAIVRIGGYGGPVYDNTFDHCYFDGVRSYEEGPSPLCLVIEENSPITEYNAVQTFTDCNFANAKSGAFINEDSVVQVGFNSCRFWQIGETGIFVSSNSVDLRIVGCGFARCCTKLASKSAIHIDDCSAATISGNMFNFESYISWPVSTRAISVGTSASINSLSISSNSFVSSSSNVSDFVNLGGTVSALSMAGNSSNNTNNTSSIVIVGNSVNSNPLALDWYEEGTWTPVLKFGGENTEVIYSARTAGYTRIGNRVHFECYIALTNKGSSTGVVTIDGLPFPQNENASNTYIVSAGNLNTSIGDANLDAGRATNTEVRIRKLALGALTTLTDVDFTNDSFINITGVYRV